MKSYYELVMIQTFKSVIKPFVKLKKILPKAADDIALKITGTTMAKNVWTPPVNPTTR